MDWLDQDWLQRLASLWQLPLYQSGNATITLGQICIALAISVLGFMVVHWLTSRLHRRLGKRMGVNGAHVLHKLVSYLLYVVIILVALPFAGIPVTIFAVLGGAVAIGIGFGAQNLINNLISGFILLIEQPIRIGDTVELEDEKGMVEDIGNRCVRIRRTDGVHVLVPNSYFLEQRVVNWTLTEAHVRGIVTLGVAYGSDLGKVKAIMLAIAAQTEQLQKEPPPEVLFDDFGDNALIISLFYWVPARVPMELKRVASGLRFRLDEAFKAADIVIAFPQRDLHLDKVQVELLAGQGTSR
ncbi:mechanosensitive ion channel family protein [Gallaecimonas xiamenensis]|uniref:Small-conductance mechanosensitive channel n=1 Tax=Gallaecimonas xiamenensis 3-C-1 TaxID=745411 RepID=K2JB41_9GAMM|nr:mechanosensitive ion channel domain-containing protein [Gallaecimonas xiamenensis]EKE67754.1 small-conductance mechanosensitive channel [Gallaecimonas xiamenensis 3-C-1]